MNFRIHGRRLFFAIVMFFVALSTAIILIWFALSREIPSIFQVLIGVAFTLSIIGVLWLIFDPDSHAARQSDEVLKLASQMLDCAKEGIDFEAAQTICELLLPTTPAMAVAITNREVVLGYTGYNAANNLQGYPIRTTATRETLEDGKPRILHHADSIGLPASLSRINAAIVEPLYIGHSIEGTLKFFYRNAMHVTKTQESVVHGFAELLSTQMAASALEEQKKLTTSMELKALQAQINPHFLFNTINTIAALIRTNPNEARMLLREFAVFYRSTLEDANDLIHLYREIKQVERYFLFEVARFGEDRLRLEVDIMPEVNLLYVPAFMVQPFVENAVKHAMRAEGALTVRISGAVEGDSIVIRIIDDGVGMNEETLANMMCKESDTGLGIAVKNVQNRIRNYFGSNSSMVVTSKLGEGTVVTIRLDKEAAERAFRDSDQLRESAVPDIPQPVVD